MKKLLCLCVILSLVLSFNCVMVSAEESRVPSNIEFTNYGEKNIVPDYVYQQSRTRAATGVQVIKGQYPDYPELAAGAHYYAFSPVTCEYSEAYTRVVLPTSLEQDNNYSGRNAYISLGVHGTAGNMGVDLGLRNTGSGWHPYCFDSYDTNVNRNFKIYDDLTIENAKKAVIIVTPIDLDTIRLYIQFQNSSGQQIDYFYQNIDVVAGNFQNGYNGNFACHYYRFASLVNHSNEPDNQNDGTYMEGGNFNGLALYKRNTATYENWGMSSTLVEKAWKVSPDKMTVTYVNGSDTEYFDIDHRP